MATIRVDQSTWLNTRFVERIEASYVTELGGRIKEDSAGNRKWQVTAHVPDARATAGERTYVIATGLNKDAAQSQASFLAEKL